MKRLSLIICVNLIVSISGCEKTNDQVDREIELTKSTEALISSDNAFGMELFKKIIAGSSEDENIIISPVSAALALAMTYNGANGATKDSMETAMADTMENDSGTNDRQPAALGPR